MIADILTGAIRSGTSVMLASQGELISERAGVINLGTEGSMLCGALGGFAVTVWTGNPWLGVLAGGIAGMLISAIHAFLVLACGANQLATGLTIMFFGMGVTSFLGRGFVSEQIVGFNPVPIPFLSDIPFIGGILFNHDPLTYLAILFVPCLWYVLFRTRLGIVLRATGERQEVLFASGINPKLVRYLAVLAGGFLAGVGGVQLSVAFTHSWVENMTQGRGVVAVALVIFASWMPARAMLGAYLFGAAQALQLTVQQQGLPISPFFLFMVPYLLTLAALLIVERKQRSLMPESLGKVFAGDGAR
ncbi:ABC transporter permease [Paenibacillus sp. FSL M8-0334]|uniref:ABC transporter permease n=2 Tax=Paenibacillus TaxID=44249 RepID=A0A268EJF2_9BACL|nr:ABC transporter permease [Paenibacillus campinasensis]MUG66186.1 ABC transporter permease [Paenibacillus campinasensis]PAD73256.1 ABC transporter permease [Paenibacillus campinasensis]PAK49415.1 ABC transporter permease [Paenibacillus sp. 7541]